MESFTIINLHTLIKYYFNHCHIFYYSLGTRLDQAGPRPPQGQSLLCSTSSAGHQRILYSTSICSRLAGLGKKSNTTSYREDWKFTTSPWLPTHCPRPSYPSRTGLPSQHWPGLQHAHPESGWIPMPSLSMQTGTHGHCLCTHQEQALEPDCQLSYLHGFFLICSGL